MPTLFDIHSRSSLFVSLSPLFDTCRPLFVRPFKHTHAGALRQRAVALSTAKYFIWVAKESEREAKYQMPLSAAVKILTVLQQTVNNRSSIAVKWQQQHIMLVHYY